MRNSGATQGTLSPESKDDFSPEHAPATSRGPRPPLLMSGAGPTVGERLSFVLFSPKKPLIGMTPPQQSNKEQIPSDLARFLCPSAAGAALGRQDLGGKPQHPEAHLPRERLGRGWVFLKIRILQFLVHCSLTHTRPKAVCDLKDLQAWTQVSARAWDWEGHSACRICQARMPTSYTSPRCRQVSGVGVVSLSNNRARVPTRKRHYHSAPERMNRNQQHEAI